MKRQSNKATPPSKAFNKKFKRSPVSVTTTPHLEICPPVPQRQIEVIEQTENSMTAKFVGGSHRKLIQSAQDPAIALNIFMDNLQRGLNGVNVAAMVPLPPWIPGAYPVSMDVFINSVLQFAQQGTTNGHVVDNFCIAPNSGPESMAIAVRFGDLNSEPFVISVANAAGGSLARLHGFYERKTVQVSQNINLPRPALLPLQNQQAFI